MDKTLLENIARDTITRHNSQYTELKKKWELLVSRYENQPRPDSITEKTDAKIKLGGAFALVENALPRMLARQPRYRYLARGREDSEAALLYDEFSNYQWEESGAQDTLKEIAKWALICGLSGWKMGWKEEIKVRKKKGKEILGVKTLNPIAIGLADKLGVGKNVKIDDSDVVSNYTIQEIKPFDLIWNVEALGIKDARVLGHRGRKTVSQLKAEGFKSTELIQYIKTTDKYAELLKQRAGEPGFKPSSIVEMAEVEICELYVKLLENDIEKYYMVITASAEDSPIFVLSVNESPFDGYIPMGVFRPTRRPAKFYGFGLIEPNEGILDAEEDTLNMALEALWTDISRPIEVQVNNIIDMSKLEYKPRTIVPVKQLGQSVAVMPTPTPNMNGVQYIEEYLTKAKQNVSGITDFQTGAEQLGGNKTLGEIQIKTQESNARLQMIMDSFEKEVIEPIGKNSMMMNQQFLAENEKVIFRILGKKGKITEKPIKFKDVEAIKDVIVVAGSSTLIAQQAEIQKWSLFLNQSAQEVQMGPAGVPINREAAWERLIEDGMLVKDVENFLPSLKEREEKGAQSKSAQIADAKEENTNPLIARVLPTDIAEVHVPLHQAEIKTREAEVSATGQQDERMVEELQMLIQHLNDHMAASGGMVPPHSAGMAVGQGLPVNEMNAQAAQGAPQGAARPQ